MLDPRNFNYDWQFLRDFFRIYYLRYLVQWFAIVPLVLVALADMPDRLAVRVTQNQYFIVNFALPFTWWLLWLSSVLYIIGWILYVLFGPAFIRRYTNYGAYQVLQHSERWIIWEWYYFLKRSAQATDVDDLIEKQLAAQCNLPPSLSDHKWQENCGKQLQITKPKKEKEETWFLFKRKNTVYRLGLGPLAANKDVHHAELFWELYGAQASSRSRIRMTIWVVLYLAGALFAVVVVQNIWAVLSHIGTQWMQIVIQWPQ